MGDQPQPPGTASDRLPDDCRPLSAAEIEILELRERVEKAELNARLLEAQVKILRLKEDLKELADRSRQAAAG